MPTPLEILLDPVSLAVLAMYAILMIWEAMFPARQLPKIKFWKVRGLTAFAFFFYLSSYLPLFTDPYLEAYRLLDLSNLGAFVGGLIGVFLYEFGVYVWHRALHTSNFLWRTFHQMHHSAERLDTYGAFYFSPLDMIGWTVLGSLCFALLVGLSPQAITVTLLVTNFMGMFQHANIETPRWMGYIVQRPESHTVHHAKGIHKHNYSDLPIFDILFGTFENPKKYEHQTGFFYGASAKVLDMLSFRDLNKEREKTKNRNRAKIKKILSFLFLVGLALSCSKDDPMTIVPDSVQDEPQKEGPQQEDAHHEDPVTVPTLTSISPVSGPKNTIVAISGTHFNTDASKVKVFFNEQEAVILTITDTVISSIVPIKAGTGVVKVLIDEKETFGPEFTYIKTREVSIYAGSAEGLADGSMLSSQFRFPSGLARDSKGNLFIADQGNHVIRKITPEGIVSTFAGTTRGHADGPSSVAQFYFPYRLSIDDNDNIYVSDVGNNAIRKITPDGIVFTYAKVFSNENGANETFNQPTGIAVDEIGNVYVADTKNHKIRVINPTGQVSTLAGSTMGFSDGLGTNAQFHEPQGLARDIEGNLYVADRRNHSIRKITLNGEVSTVAGNRMQGSADGVGPDATFSYPEALAIDPLGNLLVSDRQNNAIRLIDKSAKVSTYISNGPGNKDGDYLVAQLHFPSGLLYDAEDNLYIADSQNHRIRKVIEE